MQLQIKLKIIQFQIKLVQILILKSVLSSIKNQVLLVFDLELDDKISEIKNKILLFEYLYLLVILIIKQKV